MQFHGEKDVEVYKITNPAKYIFHIHHHTHLGFCHIYGAWFVCVDVVCDERIIHVVVMAVDNLIDKAVANDEHNG